MKNPARAGGWFLVCLVGLCGCGETPQLGSEAAMSVADAAWTAVTAHRVDLVAQCRGDLDKLQSQGEIGEKAHGVLDAVLDAADAGQWEAAAADLKEFIQGQRRVPSR